MFLQNGRYIHVLLEMVQPNRGLFRKFFGITTQNDGSSRLVYKKSSLVNTNKFNK